MVRGGTDSERLREVVAEAGRLGLDLRRGPSRCAVCNGSLARLQKSSLRRVLPEGVIEHHRLFFACADCGRIYWRGAHWKKLRRLGSALRAVKDSQDCKGEH